MRSPAALVIDIGVRPASLLLTPAIVLLLCVCGVGCGGASEKQGLAHSAASVDARTGGFPTTAYLNDGDHDGVGDNDGDNESDRDGDPMLDYKVDEDIEYHDADDSGVLRYGHAASMRVAQAVAALVEDYYVAAAAGDGTRDCQKLTLSLREAVPVDYGSYGPSYLRAGKSCSAVLKLLFEHYHHELEVPAVVTAVRVSGRTAYALVGSARMAASYIVVLREHGAWKLAQLLASENGLP